MIDIKAAEESLEKFEAMKLNKKVAYMIFKITKKAKPAKGKEITVQKVVQKADCAKEERLKTFISDLKEQGVRFAVIDW
eukprot:CAMPEP_0201564238 /NCGR_PEP_ID=MMETSP0190_2-20130828/2303_1 /ASSEMBLY_ACC=CAM_ASM_000263 /TAXON_ID=37353 /ORGANISM="Rosalina sp." /LENGTH=78 /DNA_ID=CAMNT_0047980109 /DNA_START=80 /DNA_END=313 /DNA_ORIENTATION=+